MKYIIEYIEKHVQVFSLKYYITKDIAQLRGDKIFCKNIIGIVQDIAQKYQRVFMFPTNRLLMLIIVRLQRGKEKMRGWRSRGRERSKRSKNYTIGTQEEQEEQDKYDHKDQWEKKQQKKESWRNKGVGELGVA